MKVFGISVVFYYEPVNIISVLHEVDGKQINTNKNLNNIPFPTTTSYDLDAVYYAPKRFESLNKNFWPGYILTGYTVYSDSVSNNNIISKKEFDVNTTTKMNSKNDDKRYATILPAIATQSDAFDAELIRKEVLGYGKDKIIVFNYLYPEVEINNVNYKTNQTLKDINNQSLRYKFKLIGDNMLIQSLDTTKNSENKYNEMTINLSNGKAKTFTYDVSNYSLVQVWIYTKDLNKGTKSLHKVVVGNDSFIPKNIASSKIEKIDNGYSFANRYILNTEDILTVMNKVWSDVYIEFKYYEGANMVDVSYVDEEGNTLMPSETVKMLDDIDGKKGAVVPVTLIEGYKLIEYELDGEVTDDVFSVECVEVLDKGYNRKLVFIYQKENSREELPETYQNPFAIIHSNDRENEEYDVNTAIPTDEDLYANVVTDSYIIENALSILNKSQKVNVILKKQYYSSSDDDNNGIISGIETAYATIPLEYKLNYKYYGGANAKLYIIDNAIIENDAVYDKGNFDKSGKVLMKANYKNKEPYLSYIAGGKLIINSSEQCTLLNDGETYYLEVMLSGIDYEKPNMDDITNTYKDNHEAIDNIIKENSVVNGDYLSVTAEGKNITYLDGIEIYMSAARMSNVVELSNAGYYIKDAKAPLTNGDVLFNERKIYTYEKAENKNYPSTKLTVNYMLYQLIKEELVAQNEVMNNEIFNDEDGDNIVKVYTPETLYMNSINIHTPIVNYTELISLDNSGTNHNQLIDTSIENVLTLDSVFSVVIPHSGKHIYAKDETGNNCLGYGIKEYNYNGSLLNDERYFNSKGLKLQTFAKMKLIKFSFDVYVIKYRDDGETITYKKLILANTWFNLGEISNNTGMNIEKYNFIIPTWVKDKEYGDISVRIVANNIPNEYNPKTNEEVNYIANDVSNEKGIYILEEKFRVYIAGTVYDIEIRDSDDIGWVGKLVRALTLNKSLIENKNHFLPIGQNNQNYFSAYSNGLKLGYRFYFDLKTKGIASDEIIIKPNFYYVSEDGTQITDDISLFYSMESNKYIKLDEENDLDVLMAMTKTHGGVNNNGFNTELIYGKVNNLEKNYTVPIIIGSIIKGLTLDSIDTKLPMNNVLSSAKLYGYNGNINKFVEEAKASEFVEDEKSIRNSAGHWYGEFYLPASTKVVLGSDATSLDLLNGAKNIQTDGYIVVTFDEIKTMSNDMNYLSYSMPEEASRWEKEGATYEPYEITLPNGVKIHIPNIVRGTAMAIYETSLRANDDYETEGTH